MLRQLDVSRRLGCQCDGELARLRLQSSEFWAGTEDAPKRAVTYDAMPAQVIIVSRNVHTSADLRSYFSQRGIASTATDRFDTLTHKARCSAVVVFPDEFPLDSVTACIVELAESCTSAWIVVVTRNTGGFQDVASAVSARNRERLLVLPRPAWGWDLLDRIRQPPPH